MTSAPLTTVLSGMSSIGLFASRAFVSAFAIAALLKWGPDIAWINDTGLLDRIEQVPTWFTHDITVTILGLLAALEIAAGKSADARELLNEVDAYIKSGTAFLTTLVVADIISSSDAQLIEQITAWAEPVRAGLGSSAMGFITAGFTATGVWFASCARARLLGSFMEADPEDSTMLIGALSWLEDLWAFVGAFLLILFPLVMLGITAMLLAGLAFLQWRAKRREELSKAPCGSCGEPTYICGIKCPHCSAPNAHVHAINWLGRSKQTLTQNLADHPVALMQKLRCPVCATYLKARRVRQACPACSHELFKDADEAGRYLKKLDTRLPRVLCVTAALSLIPVVGLIPAIMVYRLRLIAPLRRYTSMVRTIPTRWGLRILFLILIWVQVIPGIGVIAVPIMALISYGAYRRMFRRQMQREQANDAAASPVA